MAKTTVSGSQADIVRQLEEFVQLDVTKEKPKYNHLITLVEHVVLAFVKNKATAECEIEVDVEAGVFSFRVL